MNKKNLMQAPKIAVLAGTLTFSTALLQSVNAASAVEAVQQNSTVKGVVTDSNGDPIIGATVRVVGTKTATITNLDGHFALQAKMGAKLEVSYIGYLTATASASANTKIQMKEDSKVLNDVVVVGYGTMRKKDLTGSMVQIKPELMEAENPKTVQDVLRGVPGLSVGYSADAKGGGSLQIRGKSSLSTDGTPLIIVDGMQFYGELGEINPEDIGQIDVLKDASAAAIYGAKSANGVIIITTKRGKQGKPVIKASANWGVETLGSNNRKVYDANGYMKYRRDWYVSDTYGTNPETGAYEEYQTNTTKYPRGYFENPSDLGKYGVDLDTWRSYSTETADVSDNEVWANRLLLVGTTLDNYLTGKTFDWYDHSFRTGLNQDYNASVSGASDRINYYMSMGFMKNEGVRVGDDYRTVRASLKVNADITKWLEMGANVNFQDRSNDSNPLDYASEATKNSPFANHTDADGNLERFPMGNIAGNSGANYDFEQQYTTKDSGYRVLNSIFTAKIKLPFGISYSFNASPRYQYYYLRSWNSSKHPGRTTGSASRNSGERFDWSLNNTITWDHTFDKLHHVVLTLVQEAEERKSWSDNLTAANLAPTDALGYHYTKAGDKQSSSFSSSDDHTTADGMLARLFYSYNDRYLFTGSIRRDGYSAFGTSNPRATFWATAFAWNFVNEKFWKWNKIMSSGKLRLSYGQNGNRSIGAYVALANLGQGAGATMGYVDGSGNTKEFRYFTMDRLANTNLRWEACTSWNVGLDFGFLNDRITGSFDYYFKPTTDMIMSQKLPGFSGFGSITTNLGRIENRGFELSLNSQNIKTKDFEWNTSFGISYNKNRIKHLYYEYEDVLDANGNVIGRKESDDISNGWFINKPVGAIWTYKVEGIWQKDEAEEAAKYGQRPGDPKVWNNPANDVYNEDGTVSKIVYGNDDKVFQGQTTAPWNWSLRNDLKYRDFTLSFNLYSKMGHKSTSTAYLNNDNSGSKVTYLQNQWVKNYWTVDNPTNDYARLGALGPAGCNSPAKVYDRSFIRLENIALSYSLPKTLIAPWGIERVSLSASIHNVAVISMHKWDYWDPETGGLAPRTFNFGISVTL